MGGAPTDSAYRPRVHAPLSRQGQTDLSVGARHRRSHVGFLEEAEDIPCQPCFSGVIPRVASSDHFSNSCLFHLIFSQWNFLEAICHVG